MDINISKLTKMICSGNLGDILLAFEIISKNEDKFFLSFDRRLSSDNPQYHIIGLFSSRTKITNSIVPEAILFKKYILIFGLYVIFREKQEKDHFFYKVIANYEKETL